MANGFDRVVLEQDANSEGEGVVEHPDCEHLFGKQAVPAKPHSDARLQKCKPFGENVTQRAPTAAMKRTLGDLYRERCRLSCRFRPALRRVLNILAPISTVSPEREYRAK